MKRRKQNWTLSVTLSRRGGRRYATLRSDPLSSTQKHYSTKPDIFILANTGHFHFGLTQIHNAFPNLSLSITIPDYRYLYPDATPYAALKTRNCSWTAP